MTEKDKKIIIKSIDVLRFKSIQRINNMINDLVFKQINYLTKEKNILTEKRFFLKKSKQHQKDDIKKIDNKISRLENTLISNAKEVNELYDRVSKE